MGEVGVEASGSARASAMTLRQPAYGEYSEQPEVETQYERSDQEPARQEFGRWAQWPVLSVLALVETTWLIALAYVIHRFV